MKVTANSIFLRRDDLLDAVPECDVSGDGIINDADDPNRFIFTFPEEVPLEGVYERRYASWAATRLWSRSNSGRGNCAFTFAS
mmetsp:Transcript_26004/g.36667  ORF Transcript_26004/g.36667 Transcript_26004/m.36667 type:complete len:83 (-) Transcript_26004:164-412(-)